MAITPPKNVTPKNRGYANATVDDCALTVTRGFYSFVILFGELYYEE